MRAHVESKHYTPGYPCKYCGRIFKISKTRWTHYRKCLDRDDAEDY